MLALVAAVVLALPLAPPFGEAEVTALRSTDSTLVLEVRVEVTTGAAVVVVQPYGPDRRPLEPRPLSPLDGEVWGTILELPRRSDVRIGFEILDGGVTERSAVHTLVELGVDPALFAEPVPATVAPPPAPDGGSGYGWLALATVSAALAIALTAVWWRLRPAAAGAGDEGHLEDGPAGVVPARPAEEDRVET